MTFPSAAADGNPIAGRAFLPAVLALLLGCSGQHGAAPAPVAAAQPAQRADRGLSAEIGYNGTLLLFRVENRDTFDWSDCQFNLNAKGTDPGFTQKVASLKPGLTEAAQLRVGDFTDAAGAKFDAAAHRVTTLDFGCDTPQGRLYYGGQFQLGETTYPGRPK
ncbi:MAG: hypothetical protein WA747_11535 [Steroidobacteraceae bacterium]